ncbi:MAG: hypothetical protein HY909_08320 [Deltaproteobacteria bacterium]|nr:hypothetical protein [Deltaproteobacteria bacterium]
MRTTVHGVCVLLASLAAGCETPVTARADAAVAPPDVGVVTPVALGVYSEFVPPSQVRGALGALAARRATLQLAIPAARVGDPELLGLLREARGAGVPVRAWLLLERSEGYWPNEGNLTRYREAALALLDWTAREGVSPEALIFDVEPAYAYTLELRRTWSQGLGAVLERMRGHRDPAAFRASVAAMTELVEAVRARGVRPVCVTYPQVVDDALDGDDDLQDALDLPVRGVPWDEVSFMVYQTGFAEGVRAWIGPGLVGAYARDARRAFGERAVIALGQIGDAGIFPPAGPVYTDPAVLSQDIAAASDEGMRRVELYSLDGMFSQGGVPRWLGATSPRPEPGEGSALVILVRSLARSLDAELGAGRGDAGAP